MAVSGLTLLPSLLKESTSSSGDPYTSSSSSSSAVYHLPRKGEWATIDSADLPVFLSELAERFKEEGLDEIIEPPLREISRQVRDGRGSSNATHTGTQSNSASASAPAAEAEAARGRALQEAAAAGNVQAVLAHLLAGGAPAAGASNGLAGGRGGAGPSRSEGMTIEGMDWRSSLTAVVETIEVKPIAATVSGVIARDAAHHCSRTFILIAGAKTPDLHSCKCYRTIDRERLALGSLATPIIFHRCSSLRRTNVLL